MVADNPGVGQALIAALADFIVPLTQWDTTLPGEHLDSVPLAVESASDAHCIRPGVDISPILNAAEAIAEDAADSDAVLSRSGLTNEGKELLLALKRFAMSLVHSRESQHEEQTSLSNLDKLHEVSLGFGHTTTHIAKAVEPDTPTNIQLDDGWDGHIWEASGLGLVMSSKCYF